MAVETKIGEIFEQKRNQGRDYQFMQITGKETLYIDQDYNVLVHCLRKEEETLVELEETKSCGGNKCEISIYLLNDSSTLKKILAIFDDEEGCQNKANAATFFRKFRDSENIASEIERYSRENL